MFHKMRKHIVTVEDGMDEVLIVANMSENKIRQDWYTLRDIAISICNDYSPDVLQAAENNGTTKPIHSSCQSRVQLNNHDAYTRGVPV